MFKLTLLTFLFLLSLVFSEQAMAGVTGSLTDPISFPSLGAILTSALPLIFGLVGILAVVIFSVGALRYMASRGDAKAAEGARNTMTGAVIGLVIVLGAASLSGVFQTVFGLGFFGVDLMGPFPAPTSVDLGCAVQVAGGCLAANFANFGELATAILFVIVSIGAALFFFMLLYGGIRYMLARGDEKAVADARNSLSSALVGLLLMIGAVVIIRLIAQILFGRPTLI